MEKKRKFNFRLVDEIVDEIVASEHFGNLLLNAKVGNVRYDVWEGFYFCAYS